VDEHKHFTHHLTTARLATSTHRCKWSKLEAAPYPSAVPGSSATFWSNKVHRGPATGDGEERTVLFGTWLPPDMLRSKGSETDFQWRAIHLEPKLCLSAAATAEAEKRGDLEPSKKRRRVDESTSAAVAPGKVKRGSVANLEARLQVDVLRQPGDATEATVVHLPLLCRVHIDLPTTLDTFLGSLHAGIAAAGHNSVGITLYDSCGWPLKPPPMVAAEDVLLKLPVCAQHWKPGDRQEHSRVSRTGKATPPTYLLVEVDKEVLLDYVMLLLPQGRLNVEVRVALPELDQVGNNPYLHDKGSYEQIGVTAKQLRDVSRVGCNTHSDVLNFIGTSTPAPICAPHAKQPLGRSDCCARLDRSAVE
jgi:hypothetical protein